MKKKFIFLFVFIAIVLPIASSARCICWYKKDHYLHPSLSCKQLGFIGSYKCKDLRAARVSKDCIIKEKSGRAFLQLSGQKIIIASTAFEIFFSTLSNDKDVKSNEDFDKKVAAFLKIDDGKVSDEIINTIAKEFNLKIVKQ